MGTALKTHGGVFVIFTGWDWLATAGTRLIVEGSLFSLVLAAITTVMWVYGVRVVQGKGIIGVAVVSAILGTWLGLNVP